MNADRKQYLENIKRIVVKVGSSTLTHNTGNLNLCRIEKIVRQLVDIHNRNIEIVLVSSGAVAAGRGKLGIKCRPKTMPEKQAAAAVGQGILLHMYEKMFSEYGKTVAQILLTREDISQRGRFLNSRNTFFALFEQGVIPIVNENDVIAVDEIKFGDNDNLSAMVASLVEADLLIILSDIDGLYDSNPKDNPDAKLIYNVEKITQQIEASAGGAGSDLGTGGMATKVNAAKIATSSGASMFILNGNAHNIINDALDGELIGTLFKAEENHLQAKKHWIAFGTRPQSKIVVDSGAEEALIKKNKSLLPKGIVSVDGVFNAGEVVSIVNKEGMELAHGICNYSSVEINFIKGLDTSLIEDKLGHKDYDEIVHKNNLVILKI
ncbi:glutamate 5-kinase [Clostridium sp. DJ247]|uniref:glutamate 5-kinase n=1 Tax=Clostridium sp. DJ247 TaxID=2726188 RepID=UPI00162728F1|nr:glutamate 5-kinase [Clostridium sp. DJ247]MBC2582016.1 glutamate 5-kinase [Clostridium sp. DJ247]